QAAPRDEDRFVLGQLRAAWEAVEGQVREVGRRLKAFAQAAPPREAEARAVLASATGVGPVTVDMVVSELGDVRRFRSGKAVVAYAGLAPRVRQSAGQGEGLGVPQAGSPLLRWGPGGA